MDAFDDIRDDIAKNRFNPLKKMYFLCDDTDVFNKKVYEILISEMSEDVQNLKNCHVSGIQTYSETFSMSEYGTNMTK